VRAARPARSLLAAIALAIAVAACTDPSAPDAGNLAPPPSDPGITQPVAAVVSPAPSASPSTRLEQVRALLIASAERHHVNPYLVMGVAWWESGWDQSRVSATGAIGIMQVEPATAAAAGPRLLHRAADVEGPADNVELGVAVLAEDLDNFHGDMAKALIAYYEGPAAVTDWSDEDAGAKRYVLGVYRLAVAFSDGTGPA
jgi:soluble lytic murein transglycosylase-like protein